MDINILSDKLINSGITFFVVGLSCVTIYLLLRKRVATASRQSKRFRYRIIYIGLTVLLVLLARVWVEGFAHIFTMLSLVAAGLVVVNKETMMNLVGSLIINWRNLFAENDHIKIGEYYGYVSSIGILYFKLFEVDVDSQCYTGRNIRVPNSLVITGSVVNYSSSNHLTFNSINVPIKNTAHYAQARLVLLEVCQAALKAHYPQWPLREMMLWQRFHRNLSRLISPNPIVTYRALDDKPILIFTVKFYCLLDDKNILTNLFWNELRTRAESEESIKSMML